MADSDIKSGKTPVVDHPVFKLAMQSLIPALLSVIAMYAASINSAQKEQGEKLSAMQGQLGVMVQQNSDFSGRLSKVEAGVDEARRNIGAMDGRVLVLENLRRR